MPDLAAECSYSVKTLAGATASAWDAFVIVVGMLKGGTAVGESGRRPTADN